MYLFSFPQTSTHLRHFLKVNEVAEAEWCQVQAGLLAVVGVLNGYGHFDVVGRPGPRVVLPLPLPALARGRGWVIETPSNWTDGSFHGRRERNTLTGDVAIKGFRRNAQSKERQTFLDAEQIKWS